MDSRELQARLDQLQREHRELDSTIEGLIAQGDCDQLQIARLKKRKLRLKDEIALVQDYMIPDIIA